MSKKDKSGKPEKDDREKPLAVIEQAYEHLRQFDLEGLEALIMAQARDKGEAGARIAMARENVGFMYAPGSDDYHTNLAKELRRDLVNFYGFLAPSEGVIGVVQPYTGD